MRLVYVIGEPGIGKTTAVDCALVAPVVEHPKPFAHRVDATGLRILGPGGRPPFGGTDRLSMSVQPKVIDWLFSEMPRRVLGEGDRLANLSFLLAARQIGYETCLVAFSGNPDLALARRAARANEHALDAQNASWVAGRRTKVANLAAGWDGPLVTLDADQDPKDLAAAIRDVVDGSRL